MLLTHDRKPFASGVMSYIYTPLSPNSIDNRLILQIELENIPTSVVIDTGAPYLILSPGLADAAGLEAGNAIDRTKVEIRGIKFEGSLHRVSIHLIAEEGETLSFESTAFAPDITEEEKWGDLPNFLGIAHCLDRIRFAIDPPNDRFYFGGLP